MGDVDTVIHNLYQTFDLIGVVLNGIIGGAIARQRNFDFVGFVFLALFSALGGGMLRDVLMQKGTAAAIANPTYLLLACCGATIALVTHFKGNTWELFKVHGDAIILGVWSVTGCVKALVFDMPLVSAVFMGVLTAVGGGMIRDVVTGQIPSIFGGGCHYQRRCYDAILRHWTPSPGHDYLPNNRRWPGHSRLLEGLGSVPQQRVGTREYDRGATPGTSKTLRTAGVEYGAADKKENRGRVLTEIPSRRSVAYIS